MFASLIPVLATAADVQVTNTNDAGPGSLRQAIADVPASGVIDFSPGVFTAGSNTIALTGELLVGKTITIDASGTSAGVRLTGSGTRLVSVSSAGNLTLKRLTLSQGNSSGAAADGFGGALYSEGFIRLEDCTFSGNSAVNYGGAICSFGGLEINRCTINGNTAGLLGGGVYSAGTGSQSITNSTIAANSAVLFGGGVFHTSSLTLVHATITENNAGNKGGGVYNDFVSELTLRSSIVAGNTAPEGVNFFGPITVSPSNLTSGDPKLAPLGDYGGRTFTMPPQPDSPALDQADNEGLASDQRGFPRGLGAGSDIGSAEAEASAYNPAGLTIHTRVPSGDSTGYFEISTDPEFLPIVGTFAGTGVTGALDGPRLTSQFAIPTAAARDAFGNIFVADAGNHQIRMIDPAGTVTTIAGSGPLSGLANGPGPDARFSFPSDVEVGPDGNVYVADAFNHRICKLVRPAVEGGVWTVETLAGPNTPGTTGFLNQPGSAARFNFPFGIAIDAAGNVYVADAQNHRIRKITASGVVSTYAGSGTAGDLDSTTPSAARFDSPRDVCVIGTTVYVADTGNHRIREIQSGGSLASEVSTLAGSSAGELDGNGSAAQFDSPSGLATDGAVLYVADEQNHLIRKVTATGDVTTVAGTGAAGFLNGKSNVAQFRYPTGLTLAPDGNLIVADSENNLLRRIVIENKEVVSVPSDIISGQQQVSAVIDADALGLDPGALYYIRWVSTSGNLTQSLGLRFNLWEMPVLSTEPASNLSPISARLNATVDPKNNFTSVVFEYSTDPDLLPPFGVSTRPGSTTAGLTGAAATVEDGSGGAYVADRGNHRILHISSTGLVTTFAGSGIAGFLNGTGATARFEHPSGLARDAMGNIYVADEFNHCIRRITPGGAVSTFAGSGVAGHVDGSAASARFLYPSGVAVDAAGNVFVADTGNHRVRQVSPSGDVTTLAGTGEAGITADGPAATSKFSAPRGIAVSADGTKVWVADTANHRIRLILAGGAFTIAGNSTAGFADGTAEAALFSSPSGIALDANGAAYVSDSGNHRIRKVLADGTVTTLAGSGTAGNLDSPLPGAGLYPATATLFESPTGISITSDGRLLVTQSDRVRELARAAELPSVAISPRANGTGARLVFAAIPQPLFPDTNYYFRSVATNYRGTVTGAMLSFTTPQAGITVAAGAQAIADNQPAPIDFGNTPTGQALARQFTISNPGSYPLQISSITLPAGYQMAAGPWTIQPLESLTLSITLSAASAGTFSGDVSIASNASAQPTFTFPITGVVLDPPGVTTLAATAVTGNGATLNATINPMGSSTTAWFEWSLDPEFDGLTVDTLTTTLARPSGVATDSAGNLFVSDTLNHRIVKITPGGTVSILAGTGTAGFADGQGSAAQFNEPVGIVVTPGGVVYVADSKNHRIRAISGTGNVSTFSGLGMPGFTDGVPAAARFNLPSGLAIAGDGTLHVADRGNHRIRRIDAGGNASTLAGLSTPGATNGGSSVATFANPVGIAMDALGNTYVTEAGGHAIRVIDSGGNAAVFAGSSTTAGMTNATGINARFSSPGGLAFRADGTLLVADTGNHLIRSVNASGVVTTFAGSGTQGSSDGLGDVARFDQPISLAGTTSGEVIVGESTNPNLRKIVSTQVRVQVAAGLTGTVPLPVETQLTGLDPGATYYFRAIATNGGGTTTGASLEFGGNPFAAWQLAKFGSDAGNPAIAGCSAMPGQDGICNLLKYAFNMEPYDNTQDGLPVVSYGPGELSITYTEVIAATDLIYSPQWSANLTNWSDAGITRQTISDDGTTRRIRASIPAPSGAARFLRIVVTKPQP
jgi:predicted outer membrane repeat protein